MGTLGDVIGPAFAWEGLAFFTEAVWLQWIHMLFAAYMVVVFTVAGVYALGRLRGRDDGAHRLGFVIPFAFASVATLLQPVVGHLAGERLAEAQPSKFAAIELLPGTMDGAPLTIGGVLIDGEVGYSIQIPNLGSLIATGSPDARIVGLDDLPEGAEVPASIVTEVGRQPWIVYGVMRVDEAVTDAGWIWWSLTTIVMVYASMTVFGAVVLRAMSRPPGRHGRPGPPPDRSLDRAGVGGQPRLAHLRHRHAVDRVPPGLQCDHDHARRRALLAADVTGAAALTAAATIEATAPSLADGLHGPGAPLVVASAVGGVTTAWALLRRRLAVARAGAFVAVAAVVTGWGVAQYPDVLVDVATIDDVAGAPVTMRMLLVVVAAAGVIVVPALVWLLRLVDQPRWK